MLDGLDRVEWASLTHAYGSAEDLPELLRDLLPDDESVRKEAIYQLFGNIYHQGSRYEASAMLMNATCPKTWEVASRLRHRVRSYRS